MNQIKKKYVVGKLVSNEAGLDGLPLALYPLPAFRGMAERRRVHASCRLICKALTDGVYQQ